MRNIHRTFVLSSNGRIYGGDFAKLCGILRIYELYHICCTLSQFLVDNYCQFVGHFSLNLYFISKDSLIPHAAKVLLNNFEN